MSKKNLSLNEKKIEKCFQCGKVLHNKIMHHHEKPFCCGKCIEHYQKHGKKKKSNVCEFC